jgi:hypothetical protein
MRNGDCTPLLSPPPRPGGDPVPTTPEIIMRRSLWHAAGAIAWGAPMVLHWEL